SGGRRLSIDRWPQVATFFTGGGESGGLRWLEWCSMVISVVVTQVTEAVKIVISGHVSTIGRVMVGGPLSGVQSGDQRINDSNIRRWGRSGGQRWLELYSMVITVVVGGGP
ncbi:hypothetical protein L195_g040541, partial [Trifolium pratense]